MTPPAALTKALRRHDSALKCVWGAASKQWLIGRKMPARHPDFVAELRPPSERLEDQDRFECIKAGYFPLFTVPAERIHETERVMAGLREWDAATVGGFKEINRRLDEAQEAWEASVAKERQTFCQEAAGEAYDRLAWLQGNRIATSDMAAGAETADVIEQREGFTIRVRKGAHAVA